MAEIRLKMDAASSRYVCGSGDDALVDRTRKAVPGDNSRPRRRGRHGPGHTQGPSSCRGRIRGARRWAAICELGGRRLHIREVDDAWPRVGARIHHSVGLWPLSWPGSFLGTRRGSPVASPEFEGSDTENLVLEMVSDATGVHARGLERGCEACRLGQQHRRFVNQWHINRQ